jgi:DNA-binding CsgD family transcriptional regulator
MTLTTERQTYMLQLRRTGTSLAEICSMMELSMSSVKSCLKGAYSKLSMEHEAEESRQLELVRLDEVMHAYYDKAIEGDEKAADIVFKSMDRRAKLLGLDAPELKKVDTTFQIGWLDDDEEHSTTSTKSAQEDLRSLRPSESNVGDGKDEKRRIAEGTAQLTALGESI